MKAVEKLGLAKPLHRGKRLPEYEQENWKGDLDQYYEAIKVGGG